MSKFTPSAAEVALVNQIFIQADAQKIGVVTGDAAVKIFSGSKLPPATLAEIWNLADEDNNGVLTRKGVAIAIRLLGHAQRGERISESLIHKQGPPPSIEGLNAPVSQPLSQQNTGVRSTKSPPPGLPPLTPQDKAKFMKLFASCGPVGGLLSGEKARDVLVRSKLPVDKLSQIWNLSDTKNRGALDVTDFTVAMYLIQAAMSGQLQTIPSTLPPFLYDSAKPDSIASHATGDSGSLSPTAFGGFNTRPISTIQPNYTGSNALQPQVTGSALRPNVTGIPPTLPARTFGGSSLAFTPQPAAPQWDVTPEAKANSDRIFDTLDTAKRGYLDGDAAVPFLVQSKLPDDVLAQVWDLSDINKDGFLTKDGFAIAMHLIQGKLAGKDIPSSLPQSLIPPSKRSNGSAVAPPSQPAIPEAMRDLLWDDTPLPSTTTPQQPALAQPIHPQRTGTLSPQPTAAAPVTQHNTFGGGDPFGNPSFGAPPAAPVVHRDLLGDDEDVPTSSPPLEDKSAEIGNVQNQLNSTNRSLETTKNERAAVERQLAEQATQLSALQTQLSSAKAAYETETRLLSTLRERFSTQAQDISRTREELIRAESDLSGLRVEKAELEGSVLRDKEDIRDLQRRMTEAGMTVETLKAEIEKAKKDAKQQKGLLAIARKQLATREAERLKVEKELEESRAEAQSVTKEREDAEAELAAEPASPPQANGHDIPQATSPDLVFAAAQPLPISPEFTGKSTNPFERLALSGSPPPSAPSPFLPFADTSAVPTPVLPAGTESQSAPKTDDPFGFSEAFDEPQPTGDSRGNLSDLMSPTDTDMFLTPPSSAVGTTTFSADPASAAASHFPALDAAANFVTSPPPADSNAPREDTELDTQLKEIEQEDSDDTDSDDDEPLNAVKMKLEEKAEPDITVNGTSGAGPTATSAFDDSFGVTTLPSNATIRPGTPQRSLQSTPLRSQSPALSSHSKDAVGSPFAIPAPKQEATETPSKIGVPAASSTPADISAFDETLGKVPSAPGASAQPSQFTFDDAFDDSFDFSTTTATASTIDHSNSPSNLTDTSIATFPPAPTGTGRSATEDSFDAVFLSSGGPSAPSGGPAVEPTPAPAVQPQASSAFSFEDAFSVPSQPQQSPPQATLSPPLAQPSNSTGSLGASAISFDDAFGGVSGSEALALNNTFIPPSSAAATPATAVPQQFQPPPGPPPGQAQHVEATPFPTSSAPTSPTRDSASSISHAGRSSSPLPPRSMSPIPRLSSPKQRPGTANSTEKAEKEKTRHSKLSIRLPFGRKKKSAGAEALPPMPSSLAQQQVVEDPTPAAEDDIEAVKQLCQMGFSRGQAVGALEKYGYDVQRALNSLLGGA
ncbi:hypothetical protein BXZ70DRAFT_926963 [Cristinia sonorae]|uniref:Uncharacterized protein n=1 Tax=Cristinia sonorae TaxID=1940300 RepID=A0A8K0UUJ5_9AGAR|nr:hypothetical protein BXZ70DRAFT_926963 [Cristinia sonorae]